MARVRSGPLPLPLGVASDSEAAVVAEVGPGCRRSRWETPPPSHEFPKAVKLENRPQQFVDKWSAECSLRWFRAFQPKEALNCIIAAFTVGPDLFSLSAVLAMEKLSAEHQQELSDFYQNATAFLCPSTSNFIGYCVVCTFGRLHFRGALFDSPKPYCAKPKSETKNTSLNKICPGDPHQRNPNAPKFEDSLQKKTE